LTFEVFTGTRYRRIKRVRELQEAGRLDGELRWRLRVGAGGYDWTHAQLEAAAR
jgi:hypothetical protein